MTLLEWALKHRISPAAVRELCDTCLFLDDAPEDAKPSLEGKVQKAIRLEYAQAGAFLFRNNRGAGKMESGNYVRYGLANDSKALGAAVKSADLIGFEPVMISGEMIGSTIARFLSVEVKREDYTFTADLEGIAQVKWAALVNSQGGRAVITNRVGTATP